MPIPPIPCICQTLIAAPLEIGKLVHCRCGYRWLWNLMGWQLYIGENKLMREIPSGEVFSGNPKSPCPKLPWYSGSTGRDEYVKVMGGIMSLCGTFWGEMERGVVVENYRRIGSLVDLLSEKHREPSGHFTMVDDVRKALEGGGPLATALRAILTVPR